MTNAKRVLVATSNRGKAKEFRELLPPDFEIVTLLDLGLPSPEEDGATFADNARLKAVAAAASSGMITIADDSGLVVDALGGQPGLYSARFAGPDGEDAANRRKLLDLLVDTPDSERTARFIAVVVVASSNGIIAEATGIVEGSVGRAERGGHGFGYDPIFVLPDARTMAELDPIEKNERSHRALASKQLIPVLIRLFDSDLSATGGTTQ
jgi:XTP/dITP diphosphohydrolase